MHITCFIEGVEEGDIIDIGDGELTTPANDADINSGENINRQQPAPEIEKVGLVNLGQS